jgi:lysophospholipase L1-like esterase
MNKRNIRKLLVALASTLSVATALATPTVASATCRSGPVVIVGSSTAGGAGASTYSKSWVGQESAYLAQTGRKVVNLAKGGYTTYEALPTGRAVPSGRPAPDTARNITAALALKPSVIILNMPTNDTANSYSLSESKTNFSVIASTARNVGVPIYITTTQPRNLTEAKRARLVELRNWITTTYNTRSINFWTDLANTDGTIKNEVSAGDGIHVNDKGHAYLYQRVRSSTVNSQVC